MVIKKILIGFLVFLFIMLCGIGDYASFLAAKKYYPDLTYLEYTLLDKKLIITPEKHRYELDKS